MITTKDFAAVAWHIYGYDRNGNWNSNFQANNSLTFNANQVTWTGSRFSQVTWWLRSISRGTALPKCLDGCVWGFYDVTDGSTPMGTAMVIQGSANRGDVVNDVALALGVGALPQARDCFKAFQN